VMSAHLAVPALASAPDRPATLDPAVMSSLLRDSLHFGGMVVTDALEMGGIESRYGAAESAVGVRSGRRPAAAACRSARLSTRWWRRWSRDGSRAAARPVSRHFSASSISWDSSPGVMCRRQRPEVVGSGRFLRRVISAVAGARGGQPRAWTASDRATAASPHHLRGTTPVPSARPSTGGWDAGHVSLAFGRPAENRADSPAPIKRSGTRFRSLGSERLEGRRAA
jgi:hypothetical protein